MAEKAEENSFFPAAPGVLIDAVRRLLRPLVRLLIARSLPFPVVSAVLRGLYVDVAERDFPVGDKKQTDSRITLLTGVYRKDVKRLRRQHALAAPPPRALSLGSQLVARWMALPEYRDEAGAPRPLARVATADDAASFESLVRSVSTDIRPRVVLDEWLRLGIARVDERERVCLNIQAFIPAQGSDEMTYFFARNLHDHIAAAVHNMLGEPSPFLDRSVHYNHLTAEAVAELSELARRRAGDVLSELNARALALQQHSAGRAGASNRFNLGFYLFSEKQPPEHDDPQDGQA